MDSKTEEPLQWGDSTLEVKRRYLESSLNWKDLTDDQRQALKQFDGDNILNNVNTSLFQSKLVDSTGYFHITGTNIYKIILKVI